jgi:RHS repeat-associated protein
LHDGSQEIAELNSAGTLQTRYVFSGADQPLASIKTGLAGNTEYLYSHTDNQGSVIAFTNETRTLRGQVTYDPWGDSGNINTHAFGFGYTGQRYDSDTGLYYYKARYYHPQIGRFLSNDPIGYNDNLNMYAYVHNDPLNYRDPTGRSADAVNGQAKSKYSVDYSDCGGGTPCNVSNQGVRDELDRLNQHINEDKLGNVSVSGGDSHWDSDTQKSYSNSTGAPIDDRAESSYHNDQNGNRAVDVRDSTIDMKRPDLDRYIEKNSGFKVLDKVYNDGHIHMTCNAKGCL